MKTQLLRIFGFLLLSSLLAVHACGQDIPREGSLTSVLELWKPRDYGQNLRIIEALNTWTKPLGNDEVTALRKYAEEKEGKLWKLHFSAMQLLRKNGLLKQPTGNTRMAEELLARADTYRDNPELVDQLAAFGPEIIPLLRDVFTCDGQSEHIVAIRALRKIGGKPAVETLTYALKRENAGSVAGEFVPALLALGNDDAAVDSIAKLITSKQGFAQSHAVRAMQEAGVPNQAKMQFYSHFSEFGSDGKDAVIRALSSLGTKEAFAQLSAILLNRTGNTQLATLQLAEMEASDPGGVFEDIFKAGDITEQLMMCSAIRGCTVVIPYLQKVRSTKYQGMQADYLTRTRSMIAIA
jgi:hypothetical protein